MLPILPPVFFFFLSTYTAPVKATIIFHFNRSNSLPTGSLFSGLIPPYPIPHTANRVIRMSENMCSFLFPVLDISMTLYCLLDKDEALPSTLAHLLPQLAFHLIS